MRMKETDSQIAVSTSISTSESDSTGNLRKLQYKVKELEGELQKKDNEVTILKTRSLNKDREVDLLKYTINQQKKQPDVVKYYSQVFYKFNQHQKEWEIVFVTVQDDLKYKQLVMKMYSDYLKDVYQILELDENATHLQLMKDRSPIYPWEMNELTTAEIDINEINKFLPEPSRVPHCHFKFCWLSEIYPPKLLKMKFHLIGTKGPNNFFYIFLPRDNIPDAVSILDEMVFTFNENTETTFELPEYDLCINVPEGSVTQKTEMYIRPVLTGDFKLPPGCHQVSGIYQIECSEKLEKDISLRMGHYAVVDSQEEYANFSFYSASASTGPPYVFEKVESDSFVVDNMYASITLHHFCFFSYFWFGEKKLRYCSQMFYKIFNNGLCHIEMLFVVTENKHTLTKFVKESYKERGYDEYADQMIKFKKGETSLKVKPENEELDTWRMTAKQNPEIKKDEIDDFKPNVSGSIPHCCYSFGWPSNSSPTPLSMKFNLIGADDSNSYFNVDLHVTGSSQYSVSHGSLTADTNSQTSSSSSQDTSLYNIFKARMSKMLDVVSDPDTDRLANDLSLADLIPYSVKDHVITKNLDRYKKASILLNEIERSLRISNKPEDLKTFCEILKKLDNPSLTRIADEILKKLKNKITHPLSPSIHPPTKRLRVDEEQEEEEEEEEKEAEEKIEEEREVMRKRKRTKKSKENQVKRRK